MQDAGINENQKQLFGMIFLLAQRWQVLGDRELAETGITSKQWFLLVAIQTLFTQAPSLNELAQVMGTSRQNIKQLASNLEKRGLINIAQDPADKRTLRIRLTELNQNFWDERSDKDERFIASLFGEVPELDLETTRRTIEELLTITDRSWVSKKIERRGSGALPQTHQERDIQEETVEEPELDEQPDLHNRFDWANY